MISNEMKEFTILMTGILFTLVAIFGVGKLFNNNLNRMYLFLLMVSLLFILITFPMGVIEADATGKSLNLYTLYLLVTLGFLTLGFLGVATQRIGKRLRGHNVDTELFISMCVVFIPAGGLLCIYKFVIQYWLAK